MGLCGWTVLLSGRDMLANITLRAANQRSSGQGNGKVTAKELLLLNTLGHCINTGNGIKMWPH